MVRAKNKCITCGKPCNNKQCMECFRSHRWSWKFEKKEKDTVRGVKGK